MEQIWNEKKKTVSLIFQTKYCRYLLQFFAVKSVSFFKQKQAGNAYSEGPEALWW